MNNSIVVSLFLVLMFVFTQSAFSSEFSKLNPSVKVDWFDTKDDSDVIFGENPQRKKVREFLQKAVNKQKNPRCGSKFRVSASKIRWRKAFNPIGREICLNGKIKKRRRHHHKSPDICWTF